MLAVLLIGANRSYAAPLFSYIVGQIIPGPPISDPGPYAPNGFPMIAGNYQATTTQSYFNGTSWQPVPMAAGRRRRCYEHQRGFHNLDADRSARAATRSPGP